MASCVHCSATWRQCSEPIMACLVLKSLQDQLCRDTLGGRCDRWRDDLIVTREERDRFERDHAVATGVSGPTATDVWHSDDFTRVRVADEWHSFGPKQAAVLRLLKAASESDNPWLDGKRLLDEANAATMRLIDLFKRKPAWRQSPVLLLAPSEPRAPIAILSPAKRNA